MLRVIQIENSETFLCFTGKKSRIMVTEAFFVLLKRKPAVANRELKR